MEKLKVSGNIIKLNDVKAANTLSLLNLLLQKKEISRVELAAELDCDNTTITRAVRDLANRKLIRSAGKKEFPRGRPREMLTLDTENHCLLGISFAPAVICGVLTDFCGEVLIKEEIRFDGFQGRENYLHNLSEIISGLVKRAEKNLRAIGIAAFGSYADENYTIKNAGNFSELNGLNIYDFFKKSSGKVPVIADLLTSRLFYILRRENEKFRQGRVMLVAAGSGIGMTLAENGTPVMNRLNHGGELGHIQYDPNGIMCGCGHRGCLETEVSEKAVIEAAAKLKNKKYDFHSICSMIAGGDKELIAVAERCGRILGSAIADQINILYPYHLVVTGTLCGLGNSFTEALTQAVKQRLFPLSASPLNIDFIPFKNGFSVHEADAVGAALMAGAELISDFASFDTACPLVADK